MRSKYGNTRAGGFDSKAEGRRWDTLCLLQKAGEISDLRRQVRVDLHIGNRYMRIDFVYVDSRLGKTVYEDYKGFMTPEWKIKADIWAAGFGPGILRISRTGGRLEDIYPSPRRESLVRILEAAKRTFTDDDFSSIINEFNGKDRHGSQGSQQRDSDL